ncbi:MAG: hypothetical protein M5R42_12715 [Rhodocyclaceae bacterium]|nr:hypothetical protein [Rhodocyclaceae bacterium]
MKPKLIRLVWGGALALFIAANAWAASKEEINAEVREAVQNLLQAHQRGQGTGAEGRGHAGVSQRGQGGHRHRR